MLSQVPHPIRRNLNCNISASQHAQYGGKHPKHCVLTELKLQVDDFKKKKTTTKNRMANTETCMYLRDAPQSDINGTMHNYKKTPRTLIVLFFKRG